MAKLSDPQRIILSQASQHGDRLALPPQRLPAAARQTVAKSLIKQELVSGEHAGAYSARDAWQIDGQPTLLRITDTGLHAIGVEPEAVTAVDEAELGGLTVAEHEEEQELARAALDAGVEVCGDAADGNEPAAAAEGDFQPDAALFPAAGPGCLTGGVSAPAALRQRGTRTDTSAPACESAHGQRTCGSPAHRRDRCRRRLGFAGSRWPG
ncbi:hypothetical protein AAFN86_29040 [Roseomonas sp. CAU 1739]|uniref:hypothetical protein n=1 Tax=Roseomonas sp. CAU 1739 TaxID=3140364 RepID=UPI00325B39CA